MDSDMTDYEDDPDRCPCCEKGVVDPRTNYKNPGSPVCSNCDGTGFVGETLEDLRAAERDEASDPDPYPFVRIVTSLDPWRVERRAVYRPFRLSRSWGWL